MQLCLKLACFCLLENPAPTLLSQELGTWAPVAGVALRGPLSGDMVASCLALWFSATLWASPSPSPWKQESSPEITTRIEHSITRHACKMLNVFIGRCVEICMSASVRSPVSLQYFGGGCLQSPELASGWVRKENAFISISISYPRACWYNETIILLSRVSCTVPETFTFTNTTVVRFCRLSLLLC